MKNRKTVIVAFLLVAAMLLGVGYAALTDTLTINGTATVSADAAGEVLNEDIYFSAATIGTRSSTNTELVATGTATATVDTGDNDKGTITIPDKVLMATGDSITATYTIKNAGDLAATVSVPTITNNNETYFTVTTNWGTDAKELAAGGTIDVVVTITLVKTPVETQSATFSISFTATSDDALNANP